MLISAVISLLDDFGSPLLARTVTVKVVSLFKTWSLSGFKGRTDQHSSQVLYARIYQFLKIWSLGYYDMVLKPGYLENKGFW